MARSDAFKYKAFLSYSHADTKEARALHRRLESFRIDKDLIGRETSAGQVPKALRPVFREDRVAIDRSAFEQICSIASGERLLSLKADAQFAI